MKMTGEIKEAQDHIIKITKGEIGFLRPASKYLDLGVDWVL